jgi:hypothetical protein
LDLVEVYADEPDGVILRYKANNGDVVVKEVVIILENGTILTDGQVWWGLGEIIPTSDELDNSEIVNDGNKVYIAIAVDGGIPIGTHNFEIEYLANGNNEYTSDEVTIE